MKQRAARFLATMEPARVATPTLRRRGIVSTKPHARGLHADLLEKPGDDWFVRWDKTFDFPYGREHGLVIQRLRALETGNRRTFEVALPPDPLARAQLCV